MSKQLIPKINIDEIFEPIKAQLIPKGNINIEANTNFNEKGIFNLNDYAQQVLDGLDKYFGGIKDVSMEKFEILKRQLAEGIVKENIQSVSDVLGYHEIYDKPFVDSDGFINVPLKMRNSGYQFTLKTKAPNEKGFNVNYIVDQFVDAYRFVMSQGGEFSRYLNKKQINRIKKNVRKWILKIQSSLEIEGLDKIKFELVYSGQSWLYKGWRRIDVRLVNENNECVYGPRRLRVYSHNNASLDPQYIADELKNILYEHFGKTKDKDILGLLYAKEHSTDLLSVVRELLVLDIHNDERVIGTLMCKPFNGENIEIEYERFRRSIKIAFEFYSSGLCVIDEIVDEFDKKFGELFNRKTVLTNDQKITLRNCVAPALLDAMHDTNSSYPFFKETVTKVLKAKPLIGDVAKYLIVNPLAVAGEFAEQYDTNLAPSLEKFYEEQEAELLAMVMEKAELETDIIGWIFDAIGIVVKKLSWPMKIVSTLWGLLPPDEQEKILKEAHRISNRIIMLRDISLPMIKSTDGMGNFSFELSMHLKTELGNDIKNEVKAFNEMAKKTCIKFGLPGILYLYLMENISGSNSNIIEQIKEKNDYISQSNIADSDRWFVGNWERFAPYFKA